MADPNWTAIDAALEHWLIEDDAALRAALTDADAAGLPAISVTPLHGKLLHLLARLIDARRILEVGTLAGYSAIWLARALPPGGRLVTLELDPARADLARRNLARAGVSDRAEVITGDALHTLDSLLARAEPPFDFTFIDADKDRCPDYLARALDLTRPGGLIVVDNVVRAGRVADPTTPDPSTLGVRRMMDLIQSHPRLTATAIQTVGAKGHDGLLVARVRS